MSRITVNESVTRSVSFENNLVDVQTALDRCFQFLEEERFDEAHVIIEQVLNIEPNNTDAHVANFLYQFKLTCAEDVVKNFKECATYEDSVFYKRVKRGSQTELAKKLDFCLGRASEQLEQFNIEQERIRKEEEEHFNWGVFAGLFIWFAVCLFAAISTLYNVVIELSSSRPDITGVMILTPAGFLSIVGVYFFATMIYSELKKKRK